MVHFLAWIYRWKLFLPNTTHRAFDVKTTLKGNPHTTQRNFGSIDKSFGAVTMANVVASVEQVTDSDPEPTPPPTKTSKPKAKAQSKSKDPKPKDATVVEPNPKQAASSSKGF